MEVFFTASMPFLTLAVVHSTLTYMVKFHKDQQAIFINTWKGLSEDDPLTDNDLDERETYTYEFREVSKKEYMKLRYDEHMNKT